MITKMTVANGQVTIEFFAREAGYYEMVIECGDSGSTNISLNPSELHGLQKIIRNAQRAMMELKIRSGERR